MLRIRICNNFNPNLYHDLSSYLDTLELYPDLMQPRIQDQEIISYDGSSLNQDPCQRQSWIQIPLNPYPKLNTYGCSSVPDPLSGSHSTQIRNCIPMKVAVRIKILVSAQAWSIFHSTRIRNWIPMVVEARFQILSSRQSWIWIPINFRAGSGTKSLWFL